MGQYWQIISPSAGEALISWGKLGEFLFDGSPGGLVMRFAVPILPSESDQDLHEVLDEEKVKQQESLLSVDSQHVEHKREEDLSDRSAEQPQGNKKLEGGDAPELVQMRAHSPTLPSLPVELHELIFEKLNIKDVLCLSFTNQYFWSVGRRHIQGFFHSFLAPWAGETIICVGDYIQAGDYPLGIPIKDKEEVQQVLDRHGEDCSSYTDECEPVGCEQVGCDIRFPELFGHVLSSERYGFYHIPETIRSQMVYLLRPKLSRFYPEDQSWILRNLTTQEYVRSEAIALEPEYIHGPDIDVLGFGEVILSRVCWSTDPSVATPYEGGLHRGVWAGHRFDITTLARHEQDTREGGWKDVSEEVAAEIASIWESEYGSEWRQIVRPYGDGRTIREGLEHIQRDLFGN